MDEHNGALVPREHIQIWLHQRWPTNDCGYTDPICSLSLTAWGFTAKDRQLLSRKAMETGQLTVKFAYNVSFETPPKSEDRQLTMDILN